MCFHFEYFVDRNMFNHLRRAIRPRVLSLIQFVPALHQFDHYRLTEVHQLETSHVRSAMHEPLQRYVLKTLREKEIIWEKEWLKEIGKKNNLWSIPRQMLKSGNSWENPLTKYVHLNWCITLCSLPDYLYPYFMWSGFHSCECDTS